MWKFLRDVFHGCKVLISFGSFLLQCVLFLKDQLPLFAWWGRIAYLDEVHAVVVVSTESSVCSIGGFQ